MYICFALFVWRLARVLVDDVSVDLQMRSSFAFATFANRNGCGKLKRKTEIQIKTESKIRAHTALLVFIFHCSADKKTSLISMYDKNMLK